MTQAEANFTSSLLAFTDWTAQMEREIAYQRRQNEQQDHVRDLTEARRVRVPAFPLTSPDTQPERFSKPFLTLYGLALLVLGAGLTAIGFVLG